MARIVRATKVGVKVSKFVKAAGRQKALQQGSAWERTEPALIDRDAHASFVKNVFALRGKTGSSVKPATKPKFVVGVFTLSR